MILVAVIVILCFYTIFSGGRRTKELKRLEKELTISADSLKKLKSSYETILQRYDTIYFRLDTTKNKFVQFYQQLDSISHSTINNVEKIRKTMALIKKEHDYINKLDTIQIPGIFN
jgi:predicted  nucleic acid-binding Zn-ribbon protein